MPPADADRTLRVFLCHSSRDKARIRELYTRLRADGFAPWLDEKELLPGQDWQREIQKAVQAADVVVVCLSQDSVSREGFVNKEIKLALDIAEERPEGATFIIPVRLEEVGVPARLSQWQWANLFQENGYVFLKRSLQIRASQIGITLYPEPKVAQQEVEAQRQTGGGGIRFWNHAIGGLRNKLKRKPGTEDREPSLLAHEAIHPLKEAGGGEIGAWDLSFLTRGESRPLNEAKLILVGRGGVGKTCVVNRLVHNRFDPNEKKTDGICITRWHVRLSATDKVRLNIWDFGGQEIMHSTHQFFLSQRSLYLLVLTGREDNEDADAEYWLQLIESFGGESPVIMVLNKIKEQPFNLNRPDLQHKYPSIRKFVETDCGPEKMGLDELDAVIRREVDRLEGLRDHFPVSWFKIKDRLAVMKENYLSFERFRELCEELGEQDPDNQERLAGYLHKLGLALNFRDDPRLRDTHVLNPHWITNGIYKILNSNQLAQQNGVLQLANLADILDVKDYPASKHLFLLDLMKKFELCFEFPSDGHRYLVPELLGKEEPELVRGFQPQHCLNFEYHYNIVPEGLLPRFIVRTNILSSKKQLRWRTGVMLEFEANSALVKADPRIGKVAICVAGPADGRRRLLAVIRLDFELIHANVRKLQVKEMVPVPGRPEVVIPYGKLKVLEQKGRTKFDEVIGDDVVELDVLEMLNGIDLEAVLRSSTSPGPGKGLSTFISYSHKDEILRNELETHLKLLSRQGLISIWTDRKIAGGEEWKGEIDWALQSADIVFLLVSADFIASDYCYDVEMKQAMQRHQAKQAYVMPIILRDVDWHSAPFGKLQAFPKDAKPITLWSDRDSAWRDVAMGIRKVAEQIQSQKM